MGQHLSLQYGQVILVSRYPVLTAVNWSQHWCPKWVYYQFSCAPKLARKYEIKHWLPVVRKDGRCTVTWLPNFLGWVDFLSFGALLLTRTLVAIRRRNNFNNKSWASFWILPTNMSKVNLVRFSVFICPLHQVDTPEMMSPTTMLADDIVGWYTRTSTSAPFSLCHALLLHTESKSTSKWIKNGTNVWQRLAAWKHPEEV